MFVCGLDIEEKCNITEDQIRYGRCIHIVDATKATSD
jgi:hypothetical protein